MLDRIRALNADPRIHGILVQLPLPRQVSAAKVLETIAVAKDVDGFHVQNVGSLVVGKPGFAPCTPSGCMAMLDSIGARAGRKGGSGGGPQQHRRQTDGASCCSAAARR